MAPPPVRSPVRIRRTPLRERVFALPFDYYLSLSEWWATKDWNEPAIAAAIGFLANALMIWASSSYEPFDGIFRPNPYSRPGAILAFVLFVASILNAAVALRVVKPYTLLAQPVGEPPASKNAQLENGTWVLRMWRPDTLWFYVFIAFSPVHAMVGWLSRPASALLIDLALSGLLYVIYVAFSALVNDRFVLDAHVLKEYSHKVVYPATSVATRDVAVQVRPVSAYVLAAPSTPRREFVQRDVRTPQSALQTVPPTPTSRVRARQSFTPMTPSRPTTRR